MSYFILRNGRQYGPYAPADIERYLRAGGIVTSDLARTEEMNRWLPLAEILGSPSRPPAVAESLESEGGSLSTRRSPSAGDEADERTCTGQPVPPPEKTEVYPMSPESSVHSFSERIHHVLNWFQFGLSGSHKSGR